MKKKLFNMLLSLFKNKKFLESLISYIFLLELALVCVVWFYADHDALIVPGMIILILVQALILPTEEKDKKEWNTWLCICSQVFLFKLKAQRIKLIYHLSFIIYHFICQ